VCSGEKLLSTVCFVKHKNVCAFRQIELLKSKHKFSIELKHRINTKIKIKYEISTDGKHRTKHRQPVAFLRKLDNQA